MIQQHVVRIFVYRRAEQRLEYLVVRHKPEHDSFWTPVTGLMRPEESIYDATVRSVGEQLGIDTPHRIHDLELATHIQIGDLEEIDWAVGYGAPPEPTDLRLATDLADLRWLDFDRGYRDMEIEQDRRSIMRLHFTLKNSA